MRANILLFWVLALFFLVADGVYIGWSLLAHHSIEWVGSVALGLSVVLSTFIGFYLTRVRTAQGAELPEDLPDSNIDDGDPELGFFSPWSWWPIVLAAAASLIMLGIAIGFWMCFIGVGVLLIALVGWVFEYYRGLFAR